MTYKTTLVSPLGTLTLSSSGEALTGLWLENQKYFAVGLKPDAAETPDLPVFRQTAAWLERYFSGQVPGELPPLDPQGSPFRLAVWKQLAEIPYGKTATYGELAKRLGSSPRAVGNAVGRNPISILIPCHRVLGSGGGLTGYAGGVDRKQFLLELEARSLEKRGKFFPVPSKAGLGEGSGSRLAEPVKVKYPCPCCGYKTFPVPKEDAIAYICPICLWENDVFDPGETQPSDENRGITLSEAREAYQRFGAVREEFLQYARKPLPEEMP